MNAYPIELDIRFQHGYTIYYLISAGQVSEEWLKLLQELHDRRSNKALNTMDFLADAICACVEHFTNGERGFLTWPEEVRKGFPDNLECYNYKPEDIKFFEEGCALMDKWITPENKGIWQGTYQKTHFIVRGPVYHIIYYIH